ncbi:hypothetical protein Cflav_PD2732 [Pedosphaera parvula Ellin514]|uniref:Uncharacterized protein n=1 Tax=Pedosphaera parvula (strain Ellin514) TaxID=320771 RepID=B9XJQ2_PEDPL|nr:hypothetical protein Cflav_PD2732 [Pedosphaera parvula Ellin514]
MIGDSVWLAYSSSDRRKVKEPASRWEAEAVVVKAR